MNRANKKSTTAGKAEKSWGRRFVDKYIKPWFFSQEDPNRVKVPYIISFIMIVLTITVVILQVVIVMRCYHKNIAQNWDLTPLAGVLMVSAGGFIALYNQGKKNAIQRVQEYAEQESKETEPS